MLKIGCSWQIWNKATYEVDIKRDYLDKFGKVSDDRIGHNYDLHHIIPKRYGGPNEWWNMIPAANPEEHQSGIHRGVHKKLFPRVKKRMV